MPPKKKSVTVTEALRQAVLDSGQTLTDIAQATGIDLGNLSRFVRGKRWLAPQNIDRLAAHLGLVLVRPGGRGTIRRHAAKLLLATAIATAQAEPCPVNDALAALVSVGHSQREALAMLDRAIASHKHYASAAEILAAVYGSGRQS